MNVATHLIRRVFKLAGLLLPDWFSTDTLSSSSTLFKPELRSSQNLHISIQTFTNMADQRSQTGIRIQVNMADLAIRDTESRDNQSQNNQYGVKWVEGLRDPYPVWNVAPDQSILKELCKDLVVDIEPISAEIINVLNSATARYFRVKVKSDSALIIQYQTEHEKQTKADYFHLIFQVFMPVNPSWDTMNQLASWAWLDKNTTVPTPRVVALNSSTRQNNRLRFEWMCYQWKPGKILLQEWMYLDLGQKRLIVRQIADFLIDTFQPKHDKIGTLAVDAGPKHDMEVKNFKFHVGEMQTLPFIMRDRINIEQANRGPFKTSREWLRAQLEIVQLEYDQRREQLQDDTDYRSGDTRNTSSLIKRLLRLLPRFIPDTDGGSVERTILSFPKLDMCDIVINDEAKIIEILDLGETACLPAWAACDLPNFLKSADCRFPPNARDYLMGERNPVFQQRAIDHDLTKLRKDFYSYMERRCPEWLDTLASGWYARDFRRAVDCCDYWPAHKSIVDWLDEVERKGFPIDCDTYEPAWF